MNLSSRIYSRKVLYRVIYMFNFYRSILSKNIYLDFADKVENIVRHWLDKIDDVEYSKFDFTKLLASKKIYAEKHNDISEYKSYFEPTNEKKFQEVVSYTSSFFVNNKQSVSLDYSYIVNSMSFLTKNYEKIVNKIDELLTTFKFFELNSVDQSILLLWIVESEVEQTPKAVIIKECIFLASTFSSESSVKLINAILDKSIK